MTGFRPKIRFLCLPDLDIPIGGVKQLYRHAENLISLGWDAAILTESPDFRPSWFTSSAPSFSFQNCLSDGSVHPQNCILVLPETYISINLANFRDYDISSYPLVVFNQNVYYTFHGLTASLASSVHSFYESPNILHVLSVSEDSHTFLSQHLNIPDNRLSRIVNAVEDSFSPLFPKSNNMHWMPRKNSDHVDAVLCGLQRALFNTKEIWQAEPLVGLSHQQVANKFNESRIFLSFGHPEGFGLPIAEAMAAGCWVIGYSGGGGSELFRFGASNCVSFGDWTNFVLAVKRAFDSFYLHPRDTDFRLKRQALAVSTLYSAHAERQSIDLAWQRIQFAFDQWSCVVE